MPILHAESTSLLLLRAGGWCCWLVQMVATMPWRLLSQQSSGPGDIWTWTAVPAVSLVMLSFGLLIFWGLAELTDLCRRPHAPPAAHRSFWLLVALPLISAAQALFPTLLDASYLGPCAIGFLQAICLCLLPDSAGGRWLWSFVLAAGQAVRLAQLTVLRNDGMAGGVFDPLSSLSLTCPVPTTIKGFVRDFCPVEHYVPALPAAPTLAAARAAASLEDQQIAALLGLAAILATSLVTPFLDSLQAVHGRGALGAAGKQPRLRRQDETLTLSSSLLLPAVDDGCLVSEPWTQTLLESDLLLLSTQSVMEAVTEEEAACVMEDTDGQRPNAEETCRRNKLICHAFDIVSWLAVAVALTSSHLSIHPGSLLLPAAFASHQLTAVVPGQPGARGTVSEDSVRAALSAYQMQLMLLGATLLVACSCVLLLVFEAIVSSCVQPTVMARLDNASTSTDAASAPQQRPSPAMLVSLSGKVCLLMLMLWVCKGLGFLNRQPGTTGTPVMAGASGEQRPSPVLYMAVAVSLVSVGWVADTVGWWLGQVIALPVLLLAVCSPIPSIAGPQQQRQVLEQATCMVLLLLAPLTTLLKLWEQNRGRWSPLQTRERPSFLQAPLRPSVHHFTDGTLPHGIVPVFGIEGSVLGAPLNAPATLALRTASKSSGLRSATSSPLPRSPLGAATRFSPPLQPQASLTAGQGLSSKGAAPWLGDRATALGAPTPPLLPAHSPQRSLSRTSPSPSATMLSSGKSLAGAALAPELSAVLDDVGTYDALLERASKETANKRGSFEASPFWAYDVAASAVDRVNYVQRLQGAGSVTGGHHHLPLSQPTLSAPLPQSRTLSMHHGAPAEPPVDLGPWPTAPLPQSPALAAQSAAAWEQTFAMQLTSSVLSRRSGLLSSSAGLHAHTTTSWQSERMSVHSASSWQRQAAPAQHPTPRAQQSASAPPAQAALQQARVSWPSQPVDTAGPVVQTPAGLPHNAASQASQAALMQSAGWSGAALPGVSQQLGASRPGFAAVTPAGSLSVLPQGYSHGLPGQGVTITSSASVAGTGNSASYASNSGTLPVLHREPPPHWASTSSSKSYIARASHASASVTAPVSQTDSGSAAVLLGALRQHGQLQPGASGTDSRSASQQAGLLPKLSIGKPVQRISVVEAAAAAAARDPVTLPNLQAVAAAAGSTGRSATTNRSPQSEPDLTSRASHFASAAPAAQDGPAGPAAAVAATAAMQAAAPAAAVSATATPSVSMSGRQSMSGRTSTTAGQSFIKRGPYSSLAQGLPAAAGTPAVASAAAASASAAAARAALLPAAAPAAPPRPSAMQVSGQGLPPQVDRGVSAPLAMLRRTTSQQPPRTTRRNRHSWDHLGGMGSGRVRARLVTSVSSGGTGSTRNGSTLASIPEGQAVLPNGEGMRVWSLPANAATGLLPPTRSGRHRLLAPTPGGVSQVSYVAWSQAGAPGMAELLHVGRSGAPPLPSFDSGSWVAGAAATGTGGAGPVGQPAALAEGLTVDSCSSYGVLPAGVVTSSCDHMVSPIEGSGRSGQADPWRQVSAGLIRYADGVSGCGGASVGERLSLSTCTTPGDQSVSGHSDSTDSFDRPPTDPGAGQAGGYVGFSLLDANRLSSATQPPLVARNSGGVQAAVQGRSMSNPLPGSGWAERKPDSGGGSVVGRLSVGGSRQSSGPLFSAMAELEKLRQASFS